MSLEKDKEKFPRFNTSSLSPSDPPITKVTVPALILIVCSFWDSVIESSRVPSIAKGITYSFSFICFNISSPSFSLL